jgi:hypothetical protein
MLIYFSHTGATFEVEEITQIDADERYLRMPPTLEEYRREKRKEVARKLSRDFFEATNSMGLSNKEISEILGVSEPTISRAKKRDIYFSETRHHQWLIAELLIKARRELTRIYNHPRKEKHWFTTYNHDLRAVPIKILQTIEGLLEVVRHLESRQLP